MKHFRHGDISLQPCEKVEGELLKHNGSFVLAEGETTGHKHVLTVPNLDDMEIYKLPDGGMIFRLKAESTLTHPEHKTLTIPIGDYKMSNEREKDWFSLSVRKVVD